MSTSSPRRTPVAPAFPVVMVAIAGGSGSGKSWLSRRLQRALAPQAGRISLDDFYQDLAMLPGPVADRRNFDAPEALDWARAGEALHAVARGGTPELPCYDFATHRRRPAGRRWQRRRVVLVEGLWPWWPEWLAPVYALRIFCDAPEALRFRRRLARDRRERGRSAASIRRQWNLQSEPMFRQQVLPRRSEADVVLGPEPTPDQLRQLAQVIRRLAGLPFYP